MNNTQSQRWESFTKDNTVRLERSFAFDTPEASEYFAEEAGASIMLSTLSIFVEPVFGKPEARVVIECQNDALSIVTASHLATAFEELHVNHDWQEDAA